MLNEVANVPEVIRRLLTCLAQNVWEAIFVDDDSRDGAAELVRKFGREDTRIGCIQRIGRRGLVSACIECALSSSAPFLAVTDENLQRDEMLLLPMFQTLQEDDVDVVIGTDICATMAWATARSRA